MQALQEFSVICPYCGEHITVLIDGSIEQQEYIEDCQVCCRPINFRVDRSHCGEVSVLALHENE